LRLVPPGWEFEWLGYTWTLAVLVPLAVVGAFLLLVMVYPYLDEWITGDRRDHHILDRPRNTATRTGIGVAGMVFYGVLWAAASADVAATALNLTIESVIVVLQVTVLAGPVIAYELTRRICLGLQRKDRDLLLHGYETGRIVRLPGGEYVEVHRPLDRYERWRLAAHEPVPVPSARPDALGRLHLADRVRERLARWYLQPRIDDEPAKVLRAPRD
jgi:ubiquinol-cytochrome c reductase cytochrome b subunit